MHTVVMTTAGSEGLASRPTTVNIGIGTQTFNSEGASMHSDDGWDVDALMNLRNLRTMGINVSIDDRSMTLPNNEVIPIVETEHGRLVFMARGAQLASKTTGGGSRTTCTQ